MANPLQRLSLASLDESLLDTILSAAVNGVIAISEQGMIRMFNPACEQMFHYSQEEVAGLGLDILLASPYREEYEAHLTQFRQSGLWLMPGRGRELTARRKDGTLFPIYLSLSEAIHHGRMMLVAIIQDLSDLQHERALRAEERSFLAAIVDSSNDAIISKTLDGKITSWNRAAETLFGYSAEEMLGTSITQIFPEDRLSEEALILESIRQGEAVEHYETVRLKKDGSAVEVSATISPIKDGAGRVIGASKTLRDITERKASEARLKLMASELNHVARLSEMGQVSAAMAHELNQPLTAVLNYTNLAKRMLVLGGDGQKAMEAVTKAGEQAMRAGQIIRRLRDFVEKRESTRTLEDINAVAEDALALGLIGEESEGVQTNIQLSQNLPPTLIDKVQIQQVLVNLVRNAAEAMQERQNRILTLSTEAASGDNIIVRVADTGCGIDEVLAERLFKPFVTTKPGGMGIGLAISRSIIESHGGRLTLESNPGGGTIFQFTLPSVAPIME